MQTPEAEMSCTTTKAIEKMTRLELIDEIRRLRRDYDAADDEVTALKLKVREMDLLGTRREYQAYWAMKRRAQDAEAKLEKRKP